MPATTPRGTSNEATIKPKLEITAADYLTGEPLAKLWQDPDGRVYLGDGLESHALDSRQLKVLRRMMFTAIPDDGEPDPDQTDERAAWASFDAAVDRIHPRLRSGSGVLMGTAPTPAQIAEALAEVLPGCPSGLTLRQCECVLSLYGQERRRDAMRLVRASQRLSTEKRPDSAGSMRNQTVIYAGADPE
jgi:hypothetical protein